jgi:hypothetical protein
MLNNGLIYSKKMICKNVLFKSTRHFSNIQSFKMSNNRPIQSENMIYKNALHPEK